MEDQTKSVVETLSPEGPPKQIWEYPYFKDYLISASRGSEFLLKKNQFPKEVRLSSGWNQVAVDMQNRTRRTHSEWWSIIGVDSINRSLHLNETPIESEKVGVTTLVILENEILALKKGIDKALGGIHVHHDRDSQSSKGSDLSEIFESLFPKEKTGVFSLEDLSHIMNPLGSDIIGGVIDTDNFLLAIKTADTFRLCEHLKGLDAQTIVKIWYEANGYRYENDSPEKRKLTALDPSAPDIWTLNKKFAHAYGLVLFYLKDP